MTNQLDREHMLTVIRRRQAKYAAISNGHEWSENELSNIGWLSLVGVSWLLCEMENNGESNGKDRNSDRQPRPDCIGTLEPAFQLMLPEQTVAYTALVVPTGNPFAKLLVGFFAKVVGVSFVAHVVARSNVMYTARSAV
ncbi:MAG: hypothetical protein Q8N06_10150 [Hydrogenophaga sp.]|nr:hypothetical protein [Hydrogenophaga sp.]MDP3420640.1 hypothetical protein [Thiobacillus sp.]MDP3606160.1 hypothetical protein [Polaromonas sp.]